MTSDEVTIDDPAGEPDDDARFPSIRALARAIPRAHKTVMNWLERDDFPTRRDPPWTGRHIKVIRAWAEEELRPNRNHRAPTAEPAVHIPGSVGFTTDGIVQRLPRFCPWVSPALMRALTVADLEWVRDVWNAVIGVMLWDAAEANGYPEPRQSHRPDSEWRELFELAEDHEGFANGFFGTLVELLDARFGREAWMAMLTPDGARRMADLPPAEEYERCADRDLRLERYILDARAARDGKGGVA